MPLTGIVQVPTVIPTAPSGFQQLLAGAPELPSYPLTATVSLEDPQTGVKTTIGQTSQLIKLGNPLAIPVSFQTAGFRRDRYNYWLTVQDASGNILFNQIIYPRAVFLELAAGFGEITSPTAVMMSTPRFTGSDTVNLGETWTGNIILPTNWPAGVTVPTTLPTLPLNLLVQLVAEDGTRINVASLVPSFQPGQTINIPISYNTTQLPGAGSYDISLMAKDIKGTNLLPGGDLGNLLGKLSVLAAAAPKVPAGLSQFPSVSVSLAPKTYNYGDYVQIPVTYSHIGATEIRTIRAAIGNARVVFDEILWTEKQIRVPLDAAPVTRTETIGVLIGKEISPGVYSIYAKVSDLTRQTVSPTVTNVVQVLAAPAAPTIQPSSIPRVDVQLSATSVPVDGTLTIPFSYQHKGAEEQVTVYAAIGQRGAVGFDEILHATKTLPIPLDTDQLTHPESISIPISSAIAPWKKYGVYVKLQRIQTGRGEVISPYKYDIVTVTATPTATVSPSTVKQGQAITISFSGFMPNSAIYSAMQVIGNVNGSSDSQGRGTLTATVPTTMPAGTYTIAVTDSANHSATTRFVVQAVAAPAPAPAPQPTYTLTIASDPVYKGRVVSDPSKPTYNRGDTVRLTAQPFLNYKFSYWDVDGQFWSQLNPINYVVLATHKVTANFT